MLIGGGDGEGGVPVIDGYAAVFNSPSRPLRAGTRSFREVVLPGAFSAVLASLVGVSLLEQANAGFQDQPEIFEATASVQIEPRMADLLGQGNEIVTLGELAGMPRPHGGEHLQFPPGASQDIGDRGDRLRAGAGMATHPREAGAHEP